MPFLWFRGWYRHQHNNKAPHGRRAVRYFIIWSENCLCVFGALTWILLENWFLIEIDLPKGVLRLQFSRSSSSRYLCQRMDCRRRNSCYPDALASVAGHHQTDCFKQMPFSPCGIRLFRNLQCFWKMLEMGENQLPFSGKSGLSS